jgi:hypothetical protein
VLSGRGQRRLEEGGSRGECAFEGGDGLGEGCRKKGEIVP